MNNLNILYEDNHVIVVVKPQNILSQSDITNDSDMLTIIKQYIKKKYNKPGNVYLGLVHRLDRPVGGVMVYAKSSKAASRLQKSMNNGEFHKKYLAVCYGLFNEKEGTMEDYLLKKEDGNTIVTNKKDGKISKLKYKVISEDTSNNLSLVEIELLTGRHHQIRVQFSTRSHPLYGDQRYGRKDNKQICLWAYDLEFVHPIKKEWMKFEFLPPKIDGFKIFDNKY